MSPEIVHQGCSVSPCPLVFAGPEFFIEAFKVYSKRVDSFSPRFLGILVIIPYSIITCCLSKSVGN